MRGFKFEMTSSRLLALVALYFTFVLNWAFYRNVLQAHPFTGAAEDYFLLTIPLFIFCVLYAVYQLLALPYLHKIIIPLLLIVSASIGYNSLFYNVFFDTEMLENVLQTNAAEASRMVTPYYILWIFAFGIIPAILYLFVRVKYRTWYKEIGVRLLIITLCVATVSGIAALYYKDYASFVRNNKQSVKLIVPSNFISAGFNKIKRIQENNRPYTQIGLDAKLLPAPQRQVTVLVVGETTRAMNWGLNGYTRQTTPKLAALGNEIVNFNNVTSCGTSTAVSVPCMFSNLDRSQYDRISSIKQDNLLDIAKRAGINVVWLDNNSDCKDVCNPNNSEYHNITQENSPKYCKNGECLDDVLLEKVDYYIQSHPQQDLLLVLHTIGNHGPTYYERYTPEYEKFKPTCKTKDISKCTHEELVNTYDNSVLYIDYFLDNVIKKLKQYPQYSTALYYLSDHGESLGEKGIYLHGTPYAIAPKEQTHIPQIFWASPLLQQERNINMSCLHQNAKTQDYSQDNLFNSMLNLLRIKTDVYNPKLDIFANCANKV